MNIGDLVKLSPRKTRKGFTYESMVGLIISIFVDKVLGSELYEVNFDGQIYTFDKKELVVINDWHTGGK